MPDRIAEHYERHAHAFDSARGKRFVERHWLQRFLLPLRRGGTILDLGCGGGEPVSRFLIDSGFALTGVDSSEKMIALSRTRFARHIWLHADMRAVMLDSGFDGVLAWDSLYHLRPADQRGMIARAAAWLKPNGRLLFNTVPAQGEAIEAYHDADLYHESLEPADYRDVFGKVGLAEIAFTPNDVATGGRSIWLLRKL
jgi:2-polyprenyl-3-methyl-5-hydroxy-6-metoxy-1,4-benzoquinol methylase